LHFSGRIFQKYLVNTDIFPIQIKMKKLRLWLKFDFQSNVVPFKSYATTPSIKTVCVHNGQLKNLQSLPWGLSTKRVVDLGGIINWPLQHVEKIAIKKFGLDSFGGKRQG